MLTPIVTERAIRVNDDKSSSIYPTLPTTSPLQPESNDTMAESTRKQEKDYSAEVKTLQPEVEELAKVRSFFPLGGPSRS